MPFHSVMAFLLVFSANEICLREHFLSEQALHCDVVSLSSHFLLNLDSAPFESLVSFSASFLQLLSFHCESNEICVHSAHSH